MKFVNTDKAPKAIGPYSQAVSAGGFLFCSGQISPGGDITEQTRQVLSQLKAVLAAEGLNLANAVKTTVYLSDMNDFAKMNEVYSQEFGAHKPARACIQAARLPKDVKVEIDVIAVARE